MQYSWSSIHLCSFFRGNNLPSLHYMCLCLLFNSKWVNFPITIDLLALLCIKCNIDRFWCQFLGSAHQYRSFFYTSSQVLSIWKIGSQKTCWNFTNPSNNRWCKNWPSHERHDPLSKINIEHELLDFVIWISEYDFTTITQNIVFSIIWYIESL